MASCGAAIREPQYTRYFLSLVYCGSCTATVIWGNLPANKVSHVLQPNLKVALPQYTSHSTQDTFFFLMYCGASSIHVYKNDTHVYYCASCTAAAAVSIDVPQLESFYTVPLVHRFLYKMSVHKSLNSLSSFA